MDEETIYRKALKHWGYEPQLIMVIEEMSELTKAITKILRRHDSSELEDMSIFAPIGNIKKFIEELVDVDIMIGQMKHLAYSCGWDKEFEKEKEEKLLRVQKLILSE